VIERISKMKIESISIGFSDRRGSPVIFARTVFSFLSLFLAGG
jgi:hypothetical protein